jgi:hypothetical protein
MNEQVESKEQPEVETPKPWYRRELVVFIFGSLCIAVALVFISMALYESSGAAQLDLSRPGYKSVQNKVDESGTFESFSASGSVDRKTLDQFQTLYTKQVKSVTGKDAFSSAALDDSALGIDAPPDAE